MNQDVDLQAREDEEEWKWREWWIRERIMNNLPIRHDGVGPSGIGWDVWLSLPNWTPMQAACLSMGVNPNFFAGPAPEPSQESGEAHAHTDEVRDWVKTFIGAIENEHPEPQPPEAWVRLIHSLDREMPPQMEALLDAAIQDQDNAPAPTQETATTGKRKHTQERADRLATVIDEVESRARECGMPLDRSQWPGTKEEFRAFMKWYEPCLGYRLQDDNDCLSDELKPHGVTFLPGRNKGKGERFYKELFPKYPAK